MTSPLLYSLVLCAISATLEGILAGRGVEARFADLRLPRHSPPLPAWFVIGGVFYLICFTVLYRMFSLPASGLRDAALTLAQYMQVADSLGSIQPGMLADLVVLEGDPLADIRNTERISAVVANGRYLDRPALDLLLAEGRSVHQ